MSDLSAARPDGLVNEVVVALHDRDQLLLLRRTGFDSWSELWWFPGGGVERDETPPAAAVREVAEETGFVVPKVDYVMEVAQATNLSDPFRVYLFVARITRSAPRLNAEHDAWRWDTPHAVLDQDFGERSLRDPVFAAWTRLVAEPFISAIADRLSR
jgi:8-oxo-dGTP pyrophosphatase MutT (NUDIX family)